MMWVLRIELDAFSPFQSQVITLYYTIVGKTQEEVLADAEEWYKDLKNTGYVFVRLKQDIINRMN